MKINIKNMEVRLEKPITFVQGSYGSKGKDINLPYPPGDWTTYLPQVFKNPLSLANIVINSHRLGDQDINLKKPNWNQVLARHHELFFDLQKANKVFNSLVKIQEIVREKTSLEGEIRKLRTYETQLESISHQELYQSKQKHLQQLNENLKNIKSKYQIAKDEYLAYKNRVKQTQDRSKELKSNMLVLKEKQRELYQETNEVTKKIDDFYSKMEIYNDKLYSLKKKKEEAPEEWTEENQQSWQRIQSKKQALEDKITPLKQKKQEMMKQSHIIKKKNRQMRRLLKESKKKAFPHQKSYKRSKEQYEKLKGEYQSVQNQVENVREQLQKILKRNPAKPIDENGDKKKKESTEQIPYASKYAIQKKVEENSKRLGRIDQRLEELFETSKIDKIAIQVDKRFDRVADKVTQIEKEIQGLQLSIEDKHIVKVLVSRIKELQQLLNEFLKAIEISIHFGLLIEDQPPHEIDFELKFFKEGKALESYSELKRVEKAYMSLCFIFTLYGINELRLVPISTDLLPQKITTTKTFTKAVKLLEHNINKHLKDVRVLLFLENEYEGINNVLAMKKMEKTTKN